MARKLTYQEFIKRSNETHGNLYDYSLIEYKNNETKIEIICQKHGIFDKTPAHHLRGQGCPRCACAQSKSEIKWLESIGVLKENFQKILEINGKKFMVDGFNLSTNTIYEFFGDFWHGNITLEKYSKDKINKKNKKTFGELYEETMDRMKLFKQNGYNVIYIWENDWKKIVKEAK